MKTMMRVALLLCLLPASLASAQVDDWPSATEQAQGPRPRPVPRLTPPAGPATSWDPLRFQVGLETRTTWMMDDAARRLAGKRAPTGGGLSLQADVLRPNDMITVRVDLGWVKTSTSNVQDSTSLVERLDTNVLSLGLSARTNLLRWLAPYARLAGQNHRPASRAPGFGGQCHTPGLQAGWAGTSSP